MGATGLAPVRYQAPHDGMQAGLRHRFPPGPCRDRLAAGAALPSRTPAQLAGAPLVALRIEAVAGDASRIFPAVASRLVTTYQGCGTQWLADADANACGDGGAAPEDRVHEIATGAVAVSRGLRGATSGHPLRASLASSAAR